MASYHNPISDQRRHIKRLIENGNQEALDKIEDLQLPCPYNRLGPLDCIYTAINNEKVELVPYFVEKRNLRSENALTRALECGNIDTAKYLREKGFLLRRGNHIYSLEVMKLVVSWGCTFDSKAVAEITSL